MNNNYNDFIQEKKHSIGQFGFELKDSYYKQAVINLSLASDRFENEPTETASLF